MDILSLLLTLVFAALSAWSVGRSLHPDKREPSDSPIVENLNKWTSRLGVPEPPWKVGTLVATILIVLFIGLGVIASYRIVETSASVTRYVIIAIVLAGSTYFARSKKDVIDPGDFFNGFTQGFTWPVALPAVAKAIAPGLIDTPILTPTPIPTPTSAELFHLFVTLVSPILDWL